MRISFITSSLGFPCLKKNLGRITQINGSIVDIVFPPSKMPNTYTALVVKNQDIVARQLNMTREVPYLLGNNRVRTITMSVINGLMKRIEVIDTKASLSTSIDRVTLRRIFEHT